MEKTIKKAKRLRKTALKIEINQIKNYVKEHTPDEEDKGYNLKVFDLVVAASVLAKDEETNEKAVIYQVSVVDNEIILVGESDKHGCTEYDLNDILLGLDEVLEGLRLRDQK